MPHIRSCLLLAESAIAGGAVLVAVGRHAWYLRRGANYSLASALGGGALGGFLGAAGGTALCVARDGTANPGGGWMSAWLFRLVPFGALGLVEGAVIGVIVGVAIAWIVSRRTRRSVGG
jgi:hypothetical protein